MKNFSARFRKAFQDLRLLVFFQRFGVTPFRGGLIMCCIWIALVLLVEGASGRLQAEWTGNGNGGFEHEFGMVLFLGVMLFYVIAGIAAHEDRTQKTIAALQKLDEFPEGDVDSTIEKLGHYSLRRVLIVVMVGFIIGTASPLLELPFVEDIGVFDLARWSPEVYCHRVLGPLLGITISIFLHAIVSDSVQFWTLAGRLRSVELTDLRRYQPFTDQGLTNAAVIMGYVSMFAFLAFVDRYLFLVSSVVFYGVVAALLGLLLPVGGLRGRIAAEKEKEAKWCRERIPAARTALMHNKGGAGQELAGLLTYLRDVEAINTWPVAPGGTGRFALFLLIPVVSWGGGAVMERLLDTALG